MVGSLADSAAAASTSAPMALPVLAKGDVLLRCGRPVPLIERYLAWIIKLIFIHF